MAGVVRPRVVGRSIEIGELRIATEAARRGSGRLVFDTAVRAQLTSGPGCAIEHPGEPAVRAALAAADAHSRQRDGSYCRRNGFRYVVARA